MKKTNEFNNKNILAAFLAVFVSLAMAGLLLVTAPSIAFASGATDGRVVITEKPKADSASSASASAGTTSSGSSASDVAPFAANPDNNKLALPKSAKTDGTPYVSDLGGLLTEAQAADLEYKAESIADEFHVGVYIVTVYDYSIYGATPRKAAEGLVKANELGYGPNSDCIMLMLSMSERDYWILGYGPTANRAMTDYAREKYITPKFLDDFKDNEWFEGFLDYFDAVAMALKMEADGSPMEKENDPSRTIFSDVDATTLLICFVIGAIIAFIICMILRGKSKTVHTGTHADSYIMPNSLLLSVQNDSYSHTVVQRHLRDNGDGHGIGGGGGTSIGSGGFSGSGGKF